MIIRGYAYILGDNIDTDVIIPGKYLALKDPRELARHVLEPIDPRFYLKASKGVIIVAGVNFGMGSSREQAVIALKYAGVRAVIAESFSRIFYRNAINNGLPIAECKARELVKENELIELDMERELLSSSGRILTSCRLPKGIAFSILKAGGLLEYMKAMKNLSAED